MKLRDNDQWVEDQFADCQLGDQRRTRRLQKVARQMLASPELTSLPVETFDQAWQVLEDYEHRWLVEVSQSHYVSSECLYQLAL